ncbi:MAG TPA: 2-succinyl-5-enolpyruvyl-6-hydroxy-3-cyclohexene-1-carboxylic-acid synthase [Lacunisphaera sp.]|nr:2-succinyl-5-enolpyruvyl-6-hydroxy-3-cyclohexene-1-carboxylic-acid synthase [Lacunisphaera sp.]
MINAPESSLDFRNTNTLWCSVLVETLVQRGMRRAVISPGSRSAPLTIALARHPRIESIPVLDERSAAFFALGLAKQRGRPVALVCTSGTAAANFLPAIVEARETGVPLLVLTADRPPELRDCHSGQTIDQVKIYGGYVNHHHECAVPETTMPMLRYLRQTVAHALERCRQPVAGPVHLNCPFRDPLVPLPQALPAGINAAAFRGFFAGLQDYWPGDGVAEVALGGPLWPRLTDQSRGVIVVGPNEPVSADLFAQNVGRISRALGWPVLADALSPGRTHAAAAGHLVVHYDTLLRNEKLAAALQPAQVICIGGWPTSKVLRAWLQRADPETVIVTERPTNEDALHLRTSFARCELTTWSQGFRGKKRLAAYAKQWLDADRKTSRALAAEWRKIKGLVEPRWVGVLARELPVATTCFIASSMPVRDAEYFWPAGNGRQQFRFNRGANGIDGTLSTALGAAHGGAPAVLVTGDLALLHDTNGFLLRPKFKGSLTIVLINNEGGGIFQHLPVAQFNPPFEEFFATPQEADFKKLCSAYGVAHVRVRDVRHLAGLVAKLPPRGIRVLELRTDRKRDAAFRQDLFARLAGG